MNEVNSLTVAIVDDDASVRKGLRRLLRSYDIPSEEFASAEALLEREALDDLCCIVLDLHMPGLDGLELQEHLRQRSFCPPILFLSAHGSIPTSVKAIKAGADDFLVKPVDEAKLIDGIRAARDRYLETAVERETLREARGLLENLTPRELEVLECILSGARNRAIGKHLGITERTVKEHRARVMAKLDVNTVADLALLCARLGVVGT